MNKPIGISTSRRGSWLVLPWIKTGLAVLVSFILAVPTTFGQDSPDERNPDAVPKKTKKPRISVTISEETTWVTEPLREDGYVNYLAALNDHAREGITPQNNAAVSIWQAVGPADIDEKSRERFFELLGIPVLPEEGEYFVDLYDFARRNDEGEEASKETTELFEQLHEKQDITYNRPWTKDQYPVLANWLASNEKPLALIAEGMQRPKYYMPLVTGSDEGLVAAVSLPGVQNSRQICRVLTARAMLWVGEGDLEKAWEDLLTCHRLARHVGTGPTLIDALVGISIDAVACSADNVLAHYGKPTSAQIARFRADLDALLPLPSMAETINWGERMGFLDVICSIARGGMSVSELMVIALEDSKLPDLGSMMENFLTNLVIDWDEVLRMVNQWYDRIVVTLEIPDRAERKEALEKLEEEIVRMKNDVGDPKALAKSYFVFRSPRKTTARHMGSLLLALTIPAFSSAHTAEERVAARLELTRLAFALAAYRSQEGSYPKKLKKLRPDFLSPLPKDPFSDGRFRYRRQREGYLLYSVGPNGTDDGGRTSLDDQESDDIVVRFPIPEPQR